MSDHRRSERHLVLKTGQIISAESTNALDCAILNVSAQGACILIPNRASVPNEFGLRIDGEIAVRPCTVAWRTGARVGVSFGPDGRT
jgi:hypothetical protein